MGKPKRVKRRNTRLESEGAEFLVLGQLLIRGMGAYKAYNYMPGYDVVAVDTELESTARISVKSRWNANATGFIIKNFACDFVVVVKLNMASKVEKPPEYFVLPVAKVKDAPRSGWNRIEFKKIGMKDYENKWESIRDHLKKKAQRQKSSSEYPVLSSRDRDLFLAMPERDPTPNRALKRAALRYRKRVV